ncbi:hypothetical protein [Deinococcus arenicola]|uniref:Uncharacterized protein n=1 Tax=Deinococcus arenicola TaxID=2994950 RepID=A0ABU4DUY1_9DEIO|nr:hypothetical protein [Deinococcus sp. ZS9-10]MDV6376248.1 hypothetical protein [Deinococcus sp. ZS9-10]
MTDTLTALLSQNTRTVWLLVDDTGDSAVRVPPNTPDALAFTVSRVAAREIRENLLFAVLGRDAYVAYAQWCSQQASQDLEIAESQSRKITDPQPFDDSPPEDAHWRAHMVAMEAAADDAVLELGLISPPYAEVAGALGPFRRALVQEIVQWKREAHAEKHP